jgi:hypothetical protein
LKALSVERDSDCDYRLEKAGFAVVFPKVELLFVDLSVLHPAVFPIEQLLNECELQQTRGRGPGGQHRNKTESAIVLTHRPTGISGQASERRSQHENRAVAIERLRINLALAVRSEAPPDREPSALWKSRRVGQRLSVSETHADFPALLAEALDFLTADQFEIATTADRLGISTSQLTKFFKQLPAALVFLNQAREKLGLRKLK